MTATTTKSTDTSRCWHYSRKLTPAREAALVETIKADREAVISIMTAAGFNFDGTRR